MNALFLPVDIASIVYFRILFGAIMLWEVTRYFSHNWINRYWVQPTVHFTYWPFDFLQPLTGTAMHILFGVLGALAFFIMIGFLYRLSVILFFFGFTYTFLLEQTRYLNHFYLVVLISFILIFIPAAKNFSADALMFRRKSNWTAAWHLWLLRFTIGLPYFFGGVAKINGDWLAGEPLRSWLAHDTDFPVIGQYFTEDWMIYTIAYGGLLIDLLMIPFLLIRRTRAWAFIIALVFHLMNAKLFTIGIFPWFMIAATAIYFNPSWPRQVLGRLTQGRNRENKNRENPPQKTNSLDQRTDSLIGQNVITNKTLITAALFAWVLLHIALPVRHFFIPGNVHWTEEGHKYAWHMKLRSKKAKGEFIVIDKTTGRRYHIKSRDYLTSWQRSQMLEWPNLVWQFAQILKRDFAARGINVSVYANVRASLNGRDYQQLIDPNVDLGSVPRPLFGHSGWILPME